MAYARIAHLSVDGSTNQFDVTFPYINKTHVIVKVDGVATTAFTWLTDTRIQLTSTPSAGADVIITRETSPTTRLVDYQTGSILSETILDTDSLQAFYLSQEANDIAEIVLARSDADDQYDAGSRRIKNVTDPTGAQDASTKNYVDTKFASDVSTVAGSATAAASSATAAASSATAAASSATSAAASYDSFDDRYLGAKSSDPSVDNDGDALIDGALYFDTTANVMKVYDLGTTSWKQTTPTTTEQGHINTVSGISANVTTVAGVSANVTTVAGISSNVTSVAGNESNINTTAGISANVTTVAGISSDVTTVAGVSSDVSAVAAQSVGYAFDTSTSMADPGSGKVRFNSGTLSSVSSISIDDLDSNGVDQSAFITLWDDSTNTTGKGTLTFRTSGGDVAIFTITSLTDNSGWNQLTVSHVSSSGTFAAAELCYITFVRTGDKGADGSGSGDTSGPASSTDNAITRFDGTTGKLLQNSTATLDDSGALAAASLTLTSDLAVADGGTGSSTAGGARTNLGLGSAATSASTDFQAADADTAKTDVAQTFTVSQRGTVTTDNDISFDLNATNNFQCTPAGSGTLTFTNITSGQSGNILFINSGGHAISLHANSKGDADLASTISTAGTYWISYFSDGSNVYCVTSAVFA